VSNGKTRLSATAPLRHPAIAKSNCCGQDAEPVARAPPDSSKIAHIPTAAVRLSISTTRGQHIQALAVAGHILAHRLDRITNRDVQRGDRTMRRLTKRDTELLFEQMEALGWLTRRPGTRPTDPPHWIVNEHCHQLFGNRAKQEAERRVQEQVVLAKVFRGGR
jgi:hypothetical protein